MNLLDALTTFLQVLVLGFFWRVLAAKYAHTNVGKAMGALY